MCGRYLLTLDRQVIAGQLELPFDAGDDWPLDIEDLLTPRYNIAPSTDCLVVTAEDGTRHQARASWGFVPRFMAGRADGDGFRPINARSETAHHKPMFKQAMAGQRCLVPANGFYEWQRPQGQGSPRLRGASHRSTGQSKQPYCIWCDDSPLMTFAGLWDVTHLLSDLAQSKDKTSDDSSKMQPTMTFCILTTRANDTMAQIHDRMPVIVSPEQRQRWLDPRVSPDELGDVLEPYPDDRMRCRPVSTYVNRPQNEGPRCLDDPPAGPPTTPPSTPPATLF